MDIKNRVKLDIYGGMLGTGKTTLIKQMLATAYKGKKVAIIENEIGKVNLDEEAFENPSIQVKPITSGCVCCTVKGAFTGAVELLIYQEKPDYIIIEPSGIADFTTVEEACSRVEGIELNRAILLVNGKNFLRLVRIAGEFLFAQIRSAKTVFLNFSDALEPEHLEEVKEELWKINENLHIINVPLQEVDGDVIPDGSKEVISQPRRMISRRASGKETKSWTYEFAGPLEDAKKDALTQVFKEYGDKGLWRGKGYFDRPDGSILKLDFVYGDAYEEIVGDYPVEKRNILVAIGEPGNAGKIKLDHIQSDRT